MVPVALNSLPSLLSSSLFWPSAKMAGRIIFAA
jgi:hypothetical protein